MYTAVAIIVAVLFILSFISSSSKATNKNKEDIDKKAISKALKEISNKDIQTTNVKSGELLDRAKEYEVKEMPRPEVHHHHHHHVHVTYESKKSNDKNKDHTEAVWKRLGYQIKSGETYSYKFYGREIFTPDQVERVGQYSNRISNNKTFISTSSYDDDPSCPECGSTMEVRTAKNGRYAGNDFWGCSQFPQCRGLINID